MQELLNEPMIFAQEAITPRSATSLRHLDRCRDNAESRREQRDTGLLLDDDQRTEQEAMLQPGIDSSDLDRPGF
jgi:hypothetical protein